ncbi:MAG: hypothetical protein ACFFDT_12470, partial [Candidatus Hodarchaeota archaeon]
LTFMLDDEFLSNITFGSYDLIMTVNVAGYVSSDSVCLPMRDVKVDVISVSPSDFNNKQDTAQNFSIRIQVWNYTTLVDRYPVQILPEFLDENGTRMNPRARVKSTTTTGYMDFLGFIEPNNSAEGIYELNFGLASSVAQSFDDGTHELIISVTTKEGISDVGTKPFTAKGTVYLVKLEEVTIESNPPILYDDLVTTEDDVIFRINVNASFHIRFHIDDAEQGIPSEKRFEIRYQDPNDPENLSAILDYYTDDNGTGSINLSANDVSPTNGYELLVFVLGHRTSQEEIEPSRIKIYWDLLDFDYTYSDNHGFTGGKLSPSQKALAVDVNESWLLKLNLIYSSDRTPALGGNISYRFGSGIWNNLTDDSMIGIFNISHKHPTASIEIFECKILSGSRIDPQGTLFVNKTVGSAYFNLTVIWTYLKINMTSGEPDSRLQTFGQTNVSLVAIWAHNESLPFDGILTITDPWNIPRDTVIVAGKGILRPLIQLYTGLYSYKITFVDINENSLGISKFTNSSTIQVENPQVQVDIIWEAIDFTCSDTYDPGIPPDLQTWDIDKFFANYGEYTTLYIYGLHSYDN